MLLSHIPFKTLSLDVVDLVKSYHSTTWLAYILRRDYHMVDILSKVAHHVMSSQQYNLQLWVLSSHFLRIRHSCQSMIHSPTKGPETQNMFPTFGNCPFYSFFKIVFVLIFLLFNGDSISLIKLSDAALQTIQVSNNRSYFCMITQPSLVEHVRATICQDNIVSMVQCLCQPWQIDCNVVLDDDAIYFSLSRINFGKVPDGLTTLFSNDVVVA